MRIIIIAIFMAISILGFAEETKIQYLFSNNNVKFYIQNDKLTGENGLNYVSESNLRKNSLVKYPEKFGKLENEKIAIDCAVKVLTEIYGKNSNESKIYVISYNKSAEAWIIQETLPKNSKGGVGSVAIKKVDGEVIYISHSK